MSYGGYPIREPSNRGYQTGQVESPSQSTHFYRKYSYAISIAYLWTGRTSRAGKDDERRNKLRDAGNAEGQQVVR